MRRVLQWFLEMLALIVLTPLGLAYAALDDEFTVGEVLRGIRKDFRNMWRRAIPRA